MSIGKKTETNIQNSILDLETRINENKEAIRQLEYKLSQHKILLTRQQEQLIRKKRELLYKKDKRRQNLLWYD